MGAGGSLDARLNIGPRLFNGDRLHSKMPRRKGRFLLRPTTRTDDSLRPTAGHLVGNKLRPLSNVNLILTLLSPRRPVVSA
jgi:hypothetical protein